jgi:putative lipoic acid-binding regulatory protein
MSEQETLVQFPCDFVVKAMGRSTPEFQQVVYDIFKKHDSKFDPSKAINKPSRNGKFTSITVTVYTTSKPHLDGIYQDLTDCGHVLWSM